MIPTLYPSNHASNIMPLTNGDLLCAWFAGSKEGNQDVYILLSRLKKGDTSWSAPVVVSGDPGRSEQNPVIFPDPIGKVWLFYTAQDRYQYTSVVRYRISDDNGYTWSEIKTLFDKPGSFIRQPVVVLDNGDWLLPAYYSLKSDSDSWYAEDYSVVKISSDQGSTWEECQVPESTGMVHMNVLKMNNGSLIAFFRSRWADRIYFSMSTNDGRKWAKPEPTELPNNNASIQVIILNNGHLALVYNNICSQKYATEGIIPIWMDGQIGKNDNFNGINGRKAIWGTPRVPLTIAISEDDGKTWPFKRDLEYIEGNSASISEEELMQEFSYPSIKQTSDNRIHITYTYLRQGIKYISITEEWVKNV